MLQSFWAISSVGDGRKERQGRQEKEQIRQGRNICDVFIDYLKNIVPEFRQNLDGKFKFKYKKLEKSVLNYHFSLFRCPDRERGIQRNRISRLRNL